MYNNYNYYNPNMNYYTNQSMNTGYNPSMVTGANANMAYLNSLGQTNSGYGSIFGSLSNTLYSVDASLGYGTYNPMPQQQMGYYPPPQQMGYYPNMSTGVNANMSYLNSLGQTNSGYGSVLDNVFNTLNTVDAQLGYGAYNSGPQQSMGYYPPPQGGSQLDQAMQASYNSAMNATMQRQQLYAQGMTSVQADQYLGYRGTVGNSHVGQSNPPASNNNMGNNGDMTAALMQLLALFK